MVLVTKFRCEPCQGLFESLDAYQVHAIRRHGLALAVFLGLPDTIRVDDGKEPVIAECVCLTKRDGWHESHCESLD